MDEEVDEKKLETAILMDAICRNDKQIVKQLIMDCSQYMYEYYNGDTLLQYCIRLERYDILKMLLTMPELDINQVNHLNETVLHVAVGKCGYQIIHNIIKMGINLDIRNTKDKTALILALEGDRVDIAELLIRSGANYKLEYGANKDALKLATKRGHTGIANLIQKIDDRAKSIMQEYLKKEVDSIYNYQNGTISKEAITTYAKIKLGFSDIKLNDDNIKDLIRLYGIYYNEYDKSSTANNQVITQSDMDKIMGTMPIYIRGIRNIVGTEQSMKHNETGAETEIRKLLRRNGYKTLSRRESSKVGNPKRCFSMINFGKTIPLISVGYGLVNMDMNKIHLVSDRDMLSTINKRENTIESGALLGKRRVISRSKIPTKIHQLFERLRMDKEVKSNNEIIMDVQDKDVKFIFYLNEEEKLEAIYLQKTYQQLTGVKLPIFKYILKDDKYLKEVTVTDEQILNLLKQDFVEKQRFNTIRASKLILAFGDELRKIPNFGEFIEGYLAYVQTENGDIYNVINVAKLMGKFSTKKQQQDYLQQQLPNLLDQDLSKIMKHTKQYFYTHNRKNRELDLWLETLAQINDVATSETMEQLWNGIIDKTYEAYNRAICANKRRVDSLERLTKNCVINQKELNVLLREI